MNGADKRGTRDTAKPAVNGGPNSERPVNGAAQCRDYRQIINASDLINRVDRRNGTTFSLCPPLLRDEGL